MSTSFEGGDKSSDAREDKDVEDAEGRGLSMGEMLAEEAGVESAVASLRRTASCGKAVVDMLNEASETRIARSFRRQEDYLWKSYKIFEPLSRTNL